MIISLLIGYITALLPIWDWNTRPELFAGTIVLSITCLAILNWLQEKGENEMLRTEFNGYKEFEKKLMNAKGIELFKLSTERTRVWVNELQEIVGFIPAGDIVFVIAALSIVAEGIKKEYPEAAQTAEALLSRLRYTVKSEVINDNVTEAAGRELYKEFKNK